MRKIKRFVSWLLVYATLLTVCLFVLTAHAEEASPNEEAELPVVEITDADWLLVEKLEAFGAITNEYEDIGAYVTRRQMVDIIVKYLQLKVSGVASGQPPFQDVAKNDASIDGITALYNAGIITGDNEYKFHPDDYLTYDEAIVFVVNSVGHKLFANREGGFPTGYHRIAIKHDMLEGLKFNSGKENIPLCDVYKMLEAAMEVGAVIPAIFSDNSVDYRVSNTETFMSETYHITKKRGIVTGTENTKLTTHDSSLTDEQVEIDGIVYDTPGYVYATSIGRAVDYYIRKNQDGTYDVAYVEENEKINHIVKVDAEDLLKDKSNNERIYYYSENQKEKYVDLKTNFRLIYNHKYDNYGLLVNSLPTYGYIEALDNTGDEVADVLFVYEYDSMVVSYVDTYKESFKEMFPDEGVDAEVSLANYGDIVNIRQMPGYKKMKLEQVKPWDVVTLMRSNDDPRMITVYVSRETVVGTVTETSNEYGYFINGAYYELAPDYAQEAPKVGTTATFCLDFNGKIVAIKRDSVSAAADALSGEYAVLNGLEFGNGNSIDSTVEVRLYTASGTHITAPLKSIVNINGKPYPMGSKRDEVIALLSKTEQNASGDTYTVPQVVKYTMSGDEISSLKLATPDAPDGELNEIASGTSLLHRTDGILRSSNKTIYFARGNTLIFCTPSMMPETADLGNQSAYKIINTFPDERVYNPSSANSWDIYTERHVLYNIAGGDLDIAEVILLIGYSDKKTASGGYNGLNIITDMRTGLDDESSPAMKLYMNTSNTAFVAETVVVDGVSMKGNDINKVLAPGYTVKYTMDYNDKIDTITTVLSYDLQNKLPVAKNVNQPTYSLPNYDRDYTFFGQVTKVDTARRLIEVNNGYITELVPIKGAVVEYRTRLNDETKGTVIAGSVNSIAEGDWVIFSGTKFYSYNGMIVYKK